MIPRWKLQQVLSAIALTLGAGACGRLGFDGVGDASRPVDAGPSFTLDPAFGMNGTIVIDVGGVNNLGYSVQGIAVQPDGRIVLGGDAGTTANADMMVVRLLADGSYDGSFGTGGVATVDVFPTDGVRSVALQPDGKIVAAGGGGTALPDSAVIRLTADGALDPTFGNFQPGISTVTFAGNVNSPNGAYLGPDGRIVFGGQGATTTTAWDLVSARFDSNGALDPTYGTNGTADTDCYGFDEFGTPHAILPDRRILLVGQALHGPSFDGVVVRLDLDGTRDPTFATGGIAAIDFNAQTEQADGLAIDAQGRLIVVGRTREGPSADGFVVRLLADGSPDSTFASGTGLVVDLGGQEELENALVLPDGRIVAVGWTSHAGDDNFLVAVIRDDGTLDPSVGVGGLVEIDVVPGQSDQGWGVARDGSGRILVFGDTVSGGQNDLALVRLTP